MANCAAPGHRPSLRWRKDRRPQLRDALSVTATQVSNLLVADVIALSPATAAVFISYGMGCAGCAFARFETVYETAVAYNLDPDELAASLADAIGADERKRP